WSGSASRCGAMTRGSPRCWKRERCARARAMPTRGRVRVLSCWRGGCAGYAYEGADASFELLARRLLGEVPQFFRVDSFRVMVEKRHNAMGQLVTVSEATVRVYLDAEAEPLWSVAEGNGPVNALDQALRKDLGRYQKHIQDVELVDYKVRILPGGTEAITRVLVESRDKSTGERWFTVGVSPNIVDASFEALIDSITYKLLRAGAAAA